MYRVLYQMPLEMWKVDSSQPTSEGGEEGVGLPRLGSGGLSHLQTVGVPQP